MTNDKVNRDRARKIKKEISGLDGKIAKACSKLKIPPRDYIIRRDNIYL